MTTIAPARHLLTVSEVAARLRLSKPSVYRKIAAGDIPALRLGNGVGPLRIPEDELEAWLYGPEPQAVVLSGGLRAPGRGETPSAGQSSSSPLAGSEEARP